MVSEPQFLNGCFGSEAVIRPGNSRRAGIGLFPAVRRLNSARCLFECLIYLIAVVGTAGIMKLWATTTGRKRTLLVQKPELLGCG